MQQWEMTVLAAALALPWLLAQAQNAEKALGSANLVTGKTLHQQENCANFRAQRVGGGEAAFHVRADRKVETQVAACNSQLSLGLFPEEELDMTAYLNVHKRRG